MAISRIFGLEHLPQGETSGALNTQFGLAGLGLIPAIQVSSVPSGGILAFTVNGNKIEMAHRANASAINPGGSIGMTFRSLWGDDVYNNAANIKKLVMGLHVDVNNPANNPVGIVYNNNASVNSYHSNYGDLGYHCLSTGVVQAVANGALVANAILPSSFYAEWVFRVSGSVAVGEFYVDGILTASYTSTSSLAALITGGQTIMMGGAPATGQGTFATRLLYQTFSNWYTLYDDGTAGDAYVDRLGPITVRKIPVLSVDTNNWTPSGTPSDPASIFNLRRDNSTGTDTTATPNLTSNTDESALVARLDPSPLLLDPIAVQVSSSAVRPTAVAGNLDIAASYDGSTIAEKVFTDLVTGTVFFDRTVKPFSKLGVDEMTKANLANLRVSLKPT